MGQPGLKTGQVGRRGTTYSQRRIHLINSCPQMISCNMCLHIYIFQIPYQSPLWNDTSSITWQSPTEAVLFTLFNHLFFCQNCFSSQKNFEVKCSVTETSSTLAMNFLLLRVVLLHVSICQCGSHVNMGKIYYFCSEFSTKKDPSFLIQMIWHFWFLLLFNEIDLHFFLFPKEAKYSWMKRRKTYLLIKDSLV